MEDMNGITGFTSVNTMASSIPHRAPLAFAAPMTPTTPITFAAPAAPLPPSPGTKRKRDAKSAIKFYAVRVGKEPGIYHSWAACLDQVRGFPKATFKSFTSFTEAMQYLRGEEGDGKGTGKWYGVRSGRQPGVYTTWQEVLQQITGWKAPKHRSFKTRTEAEQYVADGLVPQQYQNGDGHPDADDVDMGNDVAPASKKLKTSKGKLVELKTEQMSPDLLPQSGEYEPGDAPLPKHMEDGFDNSVILDRSTGGARYKTGEEMTRTTYQAVGPAFLAPVRIYTDGSSLSNGTAASISGIGVWFGPSDRRNVSEALSGTKQTNQRAELTAIMRALEVAPKDRRVIIYSDSVYAIKCLVEWSTTWRRNGWLNGSHKPVENRDLIQKIIDILDNRLRMNSHREWEEAWETKIERGNANVESGKLGYIRGPWETGPGGVEFAWVKGHAANEGNNAADSLATTAAREARELTREVVLD